MITPDAIIRIAPAAKPYAVELATQMAEVGIQANVRRASGFLGQVHVESAGFTRVRENLNYSAKRMAEVWPGRYAVNPKAAEKDRQPNARAKAVAGNAIALANDTYGGRGGNTEPGDGAKFIGRGLKMITFRPNYRAFSRAWLGDESLLENPERVEQPDGAVASAIWFWLSNGLNQIADRGSVHDVTKRVNGGLIGIKQRIRWTDTYRKAWRDSPDFSNVLAAVRSSESMR